MSSLPELFMTKNGILKKLDQDHLKSLVKTPKDLSMLGSLIATISPAKDHKSYAAMFSSQELINFALMPPAARLGNDLSFNIDSLEYVYNFIKTLDQNKAGVVANNPEILKKLSIDTQAYSFGGIYNSVDPDTAVSILNNKSYADLDSLNLNTAQIKNIISASLVLSEPPIYFNDIVKVRIFLGNHPNAQNTFFETLDTQWIAKLNTSRRGEFAEFLELIPEKFQEKIFAVVTDNALINTVNLQTLLIKLPDERIPALLDAFEKQKPLADYFIPSVFNELSDHLSTTKVQMVADKTLASIQARLTNNQRSDESSSAKYDALLAEIKPKLSRDAFPILEKIVTRDYAPLEIIQLVSQFQADLMQQRDHIEAKVKPQLDSGSTSDKVTSTKEKISILDSILKTIDNFSKTPTNKNFDILTTKMNGFIDDAKKVKHSGFFSSISKGPSGTQKLLSQFMEKVEKVKAELPQEHTSSGTYFLTWFALKRRSSMCPDHAINLTA